MTFHSTRFLQGLVIGIAILSSSFSIEAQVQKSIESGHKLSLKECIGIAMEKNPSLSLDREKIYEMESLYRVARSGLFPQVSVSCYYNRLSSSRLSPGGFRPPEGLFEEESFAGVTLKQLIFDGGKVVNEKRAAAKGKEAQKEEAQATKEEVIYLLSSAYFRVVEAHNFLQVVKDSFKQRKEYLELTSSFFKAGKATKLDRLKAEAEFQEATKALDVARNNLALSKVILKKVMGMEMEKPIEIEASLPDKFVSSFNEDSLFAQAIHGNPDIRRLEAQIEQAAYGLRAAKASYFPEVFLEGGYGFRDRDIGGEEDEWTAGLFLELPLFTGGKISGEVNAAASRERQLKDCRRILLDKIREDIHQAVTAMKNATSAIESSKKQILANQEAYAAALALYKVGKATYLDVLTAQTDLTNARMSWISSITDYQIARAKLNQILGRGEEE